MLGWSRRLAWLEHSGGGGGVEGAGFSVTVQVARTVTYWESDGCPWRVFSEERFDLHVEWLLWLLW